MSNPQSSSEKQLHGSKSYRILLYMWILALLSFLAVACAVIILSHPNPPIVKINSMEALHFDMSSSSLLTASLRIQFSLENPNKRIDFSVDGLIAYLVYQGKYTILSTAINPFYLDKGAKGTMNATFYATSTFVQNHVSDDMRAQWTVSQPINFDVRIDGRAWFNPTSTWVWGYEKMWITCEGLNLGSGVLLHGPRRCKVGLLIL